MDIQLHEAAYFTTVGSANALAAASTEPISA
jgi:hypothetical protein